MDKVQYSYCRGVQYVQQHYSTVQRITNKEDQSQISMLHEVVQSLYDMQ